MRKFKNGIAVLHVQNNFFVCVTKQFCIEKYWKTFTLKTFKTQNLCSKISETMICNGMASTAWPRCQGGQGGQGHVRESNYVSGRSGRCQGENAKPRVATLQVAIVFVVFSRAFHTSFSIFVFVFICDNSVQVDNLERFLWHLLRMQHFSPKISKQISIYIRP